MLSSSNLTWIVLFTECFDLSQYLLAVLITLRFYFPAWVTRGFLIAYETVVCGHSFLRCPAVVELVWILVVNRNRLIIVGRFRLVVTLQYVMKFSRILRQIRSTEWINRLEVSRPRWTHLSGWIVAALHEEVRLILNIAEPSLRNWKDHIRCTV